MNKLKELRTLHGKKQREIADYLGIDRTTYGKYETGASEPDFKTTLKIADYFNVSLDYLLGRETEKTEQPTEYGELSAEIISIFEQLTPDNRAKLLELCHLYLDAQHKNGENA